MPDDIAVLTNYADAVQGNENLLPFLIHYAENGLARRDHTGVQRDANYSSLRPFGVSDFESPICKRRIPEDSAEDFMNGFHRHLEIMAAAGSNGQPL